MKKDFQVWRGKPFPVGATLDSQGVNFSVFSENAEKVFLCLFDEDGEEHQLEMAEQTHQIWHSYIPGIKAGQNYGYRAQGPYDPKAGHRFNFHKLLLDPYGKATSGPIHWHPSLFSYNIEDQEKKDLSFNEEDNSPYMPRSIVIDTSFDWEGDSLLHIPWHDTVIYEAHIKGFTKLNDKIPEQLRGTYAGLAHPESINYLKALGITAIELLPIQQFVEEEQLQKRGLKNYWGYNTIGYFAPEWRYSSAGHSGEQVNEFKSMVKSLHKAGLEVILDVVYNHTAEGNNLGPTLSFRGLDNKNYYRLSPDDPQLYTDFTGCGNTLNFVNPHTLRLMTDSLRYWVTEMHVDGFRFDLASALARGFHSVNQLNSFFAILRQDPILSQVKLIAEPWDLGADGYQVGNFPDYWSEWNDKYRDTLRAFWKGDGGLIGEVASRISGSSDIYENSGRGPSASINFITAHDGFTLHDLVSYNSKHNEANGENNRDGHDNNISYNWGAEGETSDEGINKQRSKIKRNFLTSLFLSQGVPMLVAGDELGKTQNGNNNSYCQDNDISWIHWDKADQDLIQFCKDIIQLRKSHRVFHRRRYFEGDSQRMGGRKDLLWFDNQGVELTVEEWNSDHAQSLALLITGNHINEHDSKNNLIQDDNFIWILNASQSDLHFKFPQEANSVSWKVLVNTQERNTINTIVPPHEGFQVQAHSTVLLIQLSSE